MKKSVNKSTRKFKKIYNKYNKYNYICDYIFIWIVFLVVWKILGIIISNNDTNINKLVLGIFPLLLLFISILYIVSLVSNSKKNINKKYILYGIIPDIVLIATSIVMCYKYAGSVLFIFLSLLQFVVACCVLVVIFGKNIFMKLGPLQLMVMMAFDIYILIMSITMFMWPLKNIVLLAIMSCPFLALIIVKHILKRGIKIKDINGEIFVFVVTVTPLPFVSMWVLNRNSICLIEIKNILQELFNQHTIFNINMINYSFIYWLYTIIIYLIFSYSFTYVYFYFNNGYDQNKTKINLAANTIWNFLILIGLLVLANIIKFDSIDSVKDFATRIGFAEEMFNIENILNQENNSLVQIVTENKKSFVSALSIVTLFKTFIDIRK